jgi:glycosyltransferase involved in cell wall biosynthesis
MRTGLAETPAQKLNIVMLGPFAWAPKGTVSVRAFFAGRALVERGHQVTILMPPYDNPADSGLEWEQDGVQLVNMRLRGDSARSRLTVPLTMARCAVRLSPNVIHIFKPISYAGLSGLYLRTLWRHVPLVLDTDDWDGPGGWADVHARPWWWKRFFAWLERWLARRADGVTVASRTLYDQIQSFGVPTDRIFYLPNGPDPALRTLPLADSEPSRQEARQARAELGLGDAPLVIYVGHIPQYNDLDLLIQALPSVINAIPDARLIIVGDGDGLPALQTRVQQAALTDHVVFTGRLAPERAAPLLAAADVAVAPYRDTLINRSKCAAKIIYYMAVGKPIVSSRVGQNLEYLDEGRAGLLTEPGNAADLATGLVALLRDPERAAELARRAKQRIWERFDWRKQIPQMEQAYSAASACSRRAKRRRRSTQRRLPNG